LAKYLHDWAWYLRNNRQDAVLGKKLRELLPSGGGFDSGTRLLMGDSGKDKLVFETAFHHMNGDGVYTHWTHHKVIFTPSFDDYDVRVTGINFDGIKGHIEDVFDLLIREYENAR